jgi:hypothetical protein
MCKKVFRTLEDERPEEHGCPRCGYTPAEFECDRCGKEISDSEFEYNLGICDECLDEEE